MEHKITLRYESQWTTVEIITIEISLPELFGVLTCFLRACGYQVGELTEVEDDDERNSTD